MRVRAWSRGGSASFISVLLTDTQQSYILGDQTIGSSLIITIVVTAILDFVFLKIKFPFWKTISHKSFNISAYLFQ